eukprot:CAMPEP_0181248070 /NCGR_PEP_ID=MMETSP1096-20121128/44964_1 /TAXON_ID=156174 ORGANISM="Chrysochromulina ericina, Strain CCMP281" /NCGR_SAMPLE_ID=MMETSP1096 /ASSEMBLY_ACC=CAM_ASM_000453 /LENGTH=44 /DNA_ID= /DNA_START= /DNA_END= /DNA_ORIENTATION=
MCGFEVYTKLGSRALVRHQRPETTTPERGSDPPASLARSRGYTN